MSDGSDSELPAALSNLSELNVEQLRCFRIDREQRRVFAVPFDQIADLWKSTTDELWLDIQEPQQDKLRPFLQSLELHPLILEDCLDPNRSSRFSSYDRSLHFATPVFAEESIDHYLSVVCIPRLLITLRTARIKEVDHVLGNLDQQMQLNEGTKSALVYTLLDALTNRLVEAATSVRNEIRGMSRLLDAKPAEVKLSEITALKRRVQDIVNVAEDQLYSVSALLAVDTEAFRVCQQRDYLRDATLNYEAALRILHRYEVGAAELYQQYVSSMQARTESRIRILTILSAICLPLTLITGIYGMNFSSMPELRIPWGYPATLMVMVLITVGQLWFFWKRGWFG